MDTLENIMCSSSEEEPVVDENEQELEEAKPDPADNKKIESKKEEKKTNETKTFTKRRRFERNNAMNRVSLLASKLAEENAENHNTSSENQQKRGRVYDTLDDFSLAEESEISETPEDEPKEEKQNAPMHSFETKKETKKKEMKTELAKPLQIKENINHESSMDKKKQEDEVENTTDRSQEGKDTLEDDIQKLLESSSSENELMDEEPSPPLPTFKTYDEEEPSKANENIEEKEESMSDHSEFNSMSNLVNSDVFSDSDDVNELLEELQKASSKKKTLRKKKKRESEEPKKKLVEKEKENEEEDRFSDVDDLIADPENYITRQHDDDYEPADIHEIDLNPSRSVGRRSRESKKAQKQENERLRQLHAETARLLRETPTALPKFKPLFKPSLESISQKIAEREKKIAMPKYVEIEESSDDSEEDSDSSCNLEILPPQEPELTQQSVEDDESFLETCITSKPPKELSPLKENIHLGLEKSSIEIPNDPTFAEPVEDTQELLMGNPSLKEGNPSVPPQAGSLHLEISATVNNSLRPKFDVEAPKFKRNIEEILDEALEESDEEELEKSHGSRNDKPDTKETIKEDDDTVRKKLSESMEEEDDQMDIEMEEEEEDGERDVWDEEVSLEGEEEEIQIIYKNIVEGRWRRKYMNSKRSYEEESEEEEFLTIRPKKRKIIENKENSFANFNAYQATQSSDEEEEEELLHKKWAKQKKLRREMEKRIVDKKKEHTDTNNEEEQTATSVSPTLSMRGMRRMKRNKSFRAAHSEQLKEIYANSKPVSASSGHFKYVKENNSQENLPSQPESSSSLPTKFPSRKIIPKKISEKQRVASPLLQLLSQSQSSQSQQQT